MENKSKIIGLVNQKGGVAKTTTALHLAIGLAEILEKKVLLIDLDPQGNASGSMGLNYEDFQNKNIYHAILEKKSLKEVIYKTNYKNLDIAPSTLDLAAVDMELSTAMAREYKLKKILQTVKSDYDYILLDCQPSLSLLTVNALTAMELCLIPIQAEIYAINGVEQLFRTVEMIKDNLNDKISIMGIFFTMIDLRTKLHKEVEQALRENISDYLLDTVIPKSIKVPESVRAEKSVMELYPDSKASLAYINLLKELFPEDNIEEKISKFITEVKNG